MDPATGYLWVARSEGELGRGFTEVYDRTGVRLHAYPVHGYDIAYDGKSKAVWLVDHQLTKLGLDGVVHVRKEIAKWCATSIAVNQQTGAVWVGKRAIDIGNDKNELLCFDADGKLVRSIDVKDQSPYRVAIDNRDGSVWVAVFGKSVRRYSADGKLEAEFPIAALSLDVDQSTRHVWVATKKEVLNIDRSGKALSRTKHSSETSSAWVTSR